MKNLFEEIVFKDTTSKDAQMGILNLFQDILINEHIDGCSFYQGCGSDICTIFLFDIHSHVFSDIENTCFDRIREKLEQLHNNRIIDKLLHPDKKSSEFYFNSQKKTIHYTNKPIEKIDFQRNYHKSLQVVFEYNPGCSTIKESFFEGIKGNLINGGYFIGCYSNLDNYTPFNRSSIILKTINDVPYLCFFEEVQERESEKDMIKFFKENLLESHSNMSNYAQFHYKGDLFVVFKYDDDYDDNWYDFKKVKKVSIHNFGLELIKESMNLKLFRALG